MLLFLKYLRSWKVWNIKIVFSLLVELIVYIDKKKGIEMEINSLTPALFNTHTSFFSQPVFYNPFSSLYSSTLSYSNSTVF